LIEEIPEKSIREWKPTKRQEEFIALPSSFFEAFYGGAAGGGKSEILLLLPILKGYIQNPRFKGIIFRRTFPQLEESLIPRSREYYPSMGGKYNGQEHVWTFPPGSTVRFSYLDKDSDARDHDTAEYHYAAFDELTAFTEFMYRYITSRVRSSDPTLPALIRSASNPGNIGHAWVRARFVEPEKNGRKIILDKLTRQKRIFIPAKLTDNPYLTSADPNYENRLLILPEAERKAKIEGDWWTFTGQVFLEFRSIKYSDEPENALHVIPPFKVPEWWPRLLAIDWGYVHMMWAGLCALSPDERVFLIKEYTSKHEKIKVWGAKVAQMCQFENLVDAVMDPSAWQERGLEKTIYTQFTESSGIDIRRADHDRVAGKLNFHDFLRWDPRPSRYIPREGFDLERSHYILRMYGPQAQKDYEKMFLPEPKETNIPRLQIFNTCTELIKVIPNCVYDEKNPEDVAKMDGDDPYDGCRYLLQAVDQYYSGLMKEETRRNTVGAIINELEHTGDMTSYYRRMEFLEKRRGAEIIPIQRFRRRSSMRVL